MNLPLGISFDGYNILAGIIFGAIGWVALSYGRKMQLWKPITIGIALMVYPYFFTNRWLTLGVGIALVITLGFHHDE